MNDTRRALLKATLWGGLLASTIDVFAASTISWVNPLRVLRFIAGGLLGAPAFSGGLGMALLGLLLQWLMGVIIAAIFVMAWRRLAWMHRDWRLTGAAYGVVIQFVMVYVVVPLSAIPPRDPKPPFDPVRFGENLLAMVLFGLIVAWFAQRYLPRPATKA